MAVRVARLVSDFSQHPLRQLAGFITLLFSVFLLLSLFTYNQSDPSLNRVTSAPPLNIGGSAGAMLADFCLQTLGLASALLVLVPFSWGWKMVRGEPIEYLWFRLCMLFLSLTIFSALLMMVEAPLSWPIASGLGGSVGVVVHGGAGKIFNSTLFVICALAMAVYTCSLAFGLTLSEWRSFGCAVKQAMQFLTEKLYNLGLWVASRRNARAQEEDEDEEEQTPWHARILPRLSVWMPFRRATDEEEYPEEEQEDEPESRPRPRTRKKTAAVATIRKAPPTRPQQSSLELPIGEYLLPSVALLSAAPRGKKNHMNESALTQNAKLLESVLQDFGVNGKIVEIRPGPVVTLYELEPAAGTKSSRVIGLADDIARSMSAVSTRIAVIPGRNAIGIELPNSVREMVHFREMLESNIFQDSEAKLPLALGKDIGGAPIVVDLARMPHLLVAGTTGSGKSVAINTMITSLVYRLTPQECKFIMIDPKMLELSIYDGIPHLLAPVVTEPGKAVVALKWTVKEMENRYRLMSNLGVRNIDGYNKKIREAKSKGTTLSRSVQTGFDPETGQPIIEQVPLEMNDLPFIVVVVDEMADLMLVAGKDIESSIQRLAQMARAAGIHIIMATQRPSVDVITGVIKANFPTRISFQVTSRIDSRTILGEQGAEQLLGQGDMLYMAGGGRITRVHGPFVSDREVEMVVEHLKSQGAPQYLEDVTRDDEAEAESVHQSDGEQDALYDEAVSIVLRDRKASTSYVQRCLKIGYNRAATIIERMEREGIVSPANHAGKREILMRESA